LPNLGFIFCIETIPIIIPGASKIKTSHGNVPKFPELIIIFVINKYLLSSFDILKIFIKIIDFFCKKGLD
jgi:hypothetical protein